MDNEKRLQREVPNQASPRLEFAGARAARAISSRSSSRGAESWSRLRAGLLVAVVASGLAVLALGCGSTNNTGACATGCVVDGVCYANGEVDPGNPCSFCDPLASHIAFSANDGVSCDDGKFCTFDDVCAAGVCTGAALSCDDGIACNGVETCSNTVSACRAGTPTCGESELCDALSGDCVAVCSGCAIEGTCWGEGQFNPLAPCQICAHAVSYVAWSDADGRSCDDGLFCTADDVCTLGVCVGASARDCGDGVACNGAETCDEGTNSCVSGETECGVDAVCDATLDACIPSCTGCVIGGTCYGAGQPNPANPCQVCRVATSRTAFSPNDGASCDDGAFCTTNDTCAAGVCAGSASDFCNDSVSCNGTETCDETANRCQPGGTTCAAGQVCNPVADLCETTCTGCVIGGVCYATGTSNPMNQCQSCTPALTRAGWSPRTAGACDDSLYCTVGETCSAGAVCGGGVPRACADAVACNGTETCSESADRCEPGTSTCAAGQVCNSTRDVCETTCSGCVIGGVCYASGTTSPANQCQICTPALSSTGWSPRTGSACDDSLYCTVGETCSATAVCDGGTARTCADGVRCNGAETCNETADRCEPALPICTGGQVCDTATDTCVLTCVGGTTLCDGTCVNTSSDPAHCGACGTRCDAGEACVSGTCSELGSHMFTTCGALGIAGPTTSECTAEYVGTTLEGEVVVTLGIQEWLVPATGTYRIEAFGAQGTSASAGRVGGRGARVRGDFALTAGQRLRIIVGQMGTADGTSGGGGGGSFVVDAVTGSPLLVAGGGGGTRWRLSQDGCGGRITELAGLGSGSAATSTCEGKANGVTLGGVLSLASYGSAGAGLIGNGAADADFGGGLSYSFVNGGNGGNCSAYGGFGGGGSGNGSAGGGGGGGYSGGDGGSVGGGGGSFNAGANADAAPGVQAGPGRVIVQRF